VVALQLGEWNEGQTTIHHTKTDVLICVVQWHRLEHSFKWPKHWEWT